MLKRAMLTVIIFTLPFALITQKKVFASEELTLNPIDDVFIGNQFPNQTHSANKILMTSSTPGNDSQNLSLFNFDLSDIPSISKIDSADLVLARQPDSDDTNVPFTAAIITEDWAQQSVTWLTKPETTGTKFPIASEDFMLGGRGYTRFDMTKLVQEWIKNKDTSYGFQLEGPKNMQYMKKYLSSRDVVKPRLVVEYSVLTGIIQKEAYLLQDDTGDMAETAETGDAIEDIAMDDTADSTVAESEKDTSTGTLQDSLNEVLTPTNIKIAIGAVFLLILVKILLSKRS